MRAPLSRHVLRVLCISTVCIHAAENQYSAWIHDGLGSSMESPRTNWNPGSKHEYAYSLDVERMFF